MIKKKALSTFIIVLLVSMVAAMFFKVALVYATTPSFSAVHVDFGSDASPVQSGFVGLGATNGYSDSVGYGWMTEANASTNMAQIDRGVIGGDSYSDLHRDGHYAGACTRFFLVYVNKTATYDWAWHWGDISYSGGPFDLWVQNVKVGSALTYDHNCLNLTGSASGTANTFFNFTVVIAVTSDFNGVELEAETASYYTEFDMGNSTSPVQSGFHRVTGSDLYNTSENHYGWNASLSDLSYTPGPGGAYDDLERDGCWGGPSGPRMFTVDVTHSGTFNIQVWHWNSGYANGGFYIIVQGAYAVKNRTFDYGSDPYIMNFSAFSTSGKIEFVFGSTVDNWIVNGISITYISTLYDTLSDLTHWTSYVDTPLITTVNQTGSSGLQFNTSQTWVGDQSFGGEVLNGTKYTTMPSLYLSNPDTSTFSNGTIEFDLHTPALPGAGDDFIIAVTFRMQNESSYYAFVMKWGSNYGATEYNAWPWSFFKYNKLDNVTNPWTCLSPNVAYPPMSPNSTYHVCLIISGSEFLATFPYGNSFVTMPGSDSTWSDGTWGGIGLYLLYSPVNPLWIDNFAFSPTVAYDRDFHPLSYYVDEIQVHSGSRANWFTTQYLFDTYQTNITNLFAFTDFYITEATNYIGINFTTGYLINFTNPQDGHIGIEVTGGGLGGYCSSGNGVYRPVFSPDEDYPYISVGKDCFTYAAGGSWLGHNVTGYYAYIMIAHELMNTFNWFAPVNVPGWAADGKSPFPYEFKTVPMDLAGDDIGGTQGADISAIAIFEETFPRTPGYFLGGAYWPDWGVVNLHQWITDYPNYYQNALAALREDKVSFGWTMYANETGSYPIITDLDLRSAYFQIYLEYGADVHSLNWTWGNFVNTGALYIPASQNNGTLRSTLTSIHNLLTNIRNYTAQWQGMGGDVTAINATMETAWMYWRQGYYISASTTALPIYAELAEDLGLAGPGGAPIPVNAFYISPVYIFFGKVGDILGCLGAIAVLYSRTKDIKSGLKAFVITMFIAIIFFIIWYVMTSLETFA